MKDTFISLIAIVILISLLLPAISCQETSSVTPTPTVTPIQTPTPTPTPQVWSDGRVDMVVDKVERTIALPAEFLKGCDPTYLKNCPKRSPDEGNEFVCIYLTFTQIKGIHVLDASIGGLFDNGGRTVEEPIVYSLPVQLDDILHPELSEVKEGTAIMVYEVPKHQELASLRIVYAYKVNWEDTSSKTSQIDIAL